MRYSLRYYDCFSRCHMSLKLMSMPSLFGNGAKLRTITAGLAAASRRWRDRRLAVAGLRRRGVERAALRRRNTTDTHSRLKPLLYVLLTLSYKLALIAIRSALCTLHSARLSLHTSHRQRRPAERKFGTAPITRSRPGRPRPGCMLRRRPATSL